MIFRVVMSRSLVVTQCMGDTMRQGIIRSLAAVTVLGGLLVSGTGVAAADSAPMAASAHMTAPARPCPAVHAPDLPPCPGS